MFYLSTKNLNSPPKTKNIKTEKRKKPKSHSPKHTATMPVLILLKHILILGIPTTTLSIRSPNRYPHILSKLLPARWSNDWKHWHDLSCTSMQFDSAKPNFLNGDDSQICPLLHPLLPQLPRSLTVSYCELTINRKKSS